MKNLFLLLIFLLGGLNLANGAKSKTFKVMAQPKEASIFVNNQFVGYGFAEFNRPKKKTDVIAIRIECEGYKPLETKIYADDVRSSVSYTLQDDGFYRATAASGLVNKFMTVTLDNSLYTIDEQGTINVTKAWRLLHQILLNYFEEIATTDYSGGYLQTPWHYKTFQLSDKQMRTRVTVRDISTPAQVAFQIKVSSEVASAMAARHGEFTNVDRIVKELEPMLQELQTRLGKMHSL
ncbi:hypothetical protein B5E60_12910 [Alistipes sp. An116]|uniref:hypothetical protein n=1 Tax=Alistipes sp. An116 TaxID=1965546 RepID=UPI000B55D3C2|nr:hypothetical protein [Alistipes sp. An116]OUQ50700.1 hypothetical protein B5E60_12910 [Alistipes sp. An116]